MEILSSFIGDKHEFCLVVIEHIGRLVDGSNPGSSMLFP